MLAELRDALTALAREAEHASVSSVDTMENTLVMLGMKLREISGVPRT